MTDTLNLTITDAIGCIEINNQARRNAFDLAMWQKLPQLVQQLDQNSAVRLIILRGVGKSAFCSGADISEFSTVRATAAGGKAYEQANEAAFAALAHCSKPTLAAIRGFCMGGGVGLAASCDLRIAESGTEFGIPAARLGVGYPHWWWPRWGCKRQWIYLPLPAASKLRKRSASAFSPAFSRRRVSRRSLPKWRKPLLPMPH